MQADETVECDDIPEIGTATATDNCDDDVLVEFVEEKIEEGECTDSYTIIRIWEATDNCGNKTIRSQVITVQDTTDPELTIPTDETVECDMVPEAGMASATDNCDDDVDVTYDGQTITPGDCENSYTITRTWTATDNCDNKTTRSQTITVVDTTDPELTVPADETVECDSIPPVEPAQASDNCDDEVELTYDGEEITPGECEDSYTITRTWTATDNCDNKTTRSQTITVVDTTNPELTMPANVTVECDSIPEAGMASATDNCDDDVTVTYDGEQIIPSGSE